MQEYEHKPGYYITFGYGGNIVYKKYQQVINLENC